MAMGWPEEGKEVKNERKSSCRRRWRAMRRSKRSKVAASGSSPLMSR